MSDWSSLALVIVIGLALIAVVIALVLAGPGRSRRDRAVQRPDRDSFRRKRSQRRPRRAAIIINPSKFKDPAATKAELTTASKELGWQEPLFIETTIEDPGTGQARQALEEGVDVVCPLGGDGTIRAVAVALAHTHTPMGLLPRGTGNLLARNLDIPFGADLVAALKVAYNGRNKPIDVAWLELDPVEETETEDAGQAERPVEGPSVDRHPFLVMAGMGFDAEIMSGTSEDFKAKVGWISYFVTGARKLFIKRFRVRLTVDGESGSPARARSVIFCNCGTLQGGIQLVPTARIDDGLLDGVVVAPKTIIGWGSIAVRVLGRSTRNATELTRSSASVYTAEVEARRPVQVDGDVIGEATRVRATVDDRALIVRVAGTP
ncbi:diacylglycerol/lipid kinase family protein [Janibacter corallicola]|uniref:diacylglycerol/lipid kinase family protein n=1 Tax=Janibacter corallicola TaxID=415212 RepID=UPI0008356BFD|nr:diacylglycerol kinase family protein [Janibacter corallicola]